MPNYTDKSEKDPAQGDLFQNRIGLLEAAQQVAKVRSHHFPGTAVVTVRYGSGYGLKLCKRLVYRRASGQNNERKRSLHALPLALNLFRYFS